MPPDFITNKPAHRVVMKAEQDYRCANPQRWPPSHEPNCTAAMHVLWYHDRLL